MTHEWTRAEYTISSDPCRLDVDLIHDFLSTRSYWAAGRSRERVVCSIEHSLPFGLYHPSGQVGFARVVTDFVVIAFLADVFVLEGHRGGGLGKWLVETVMRTICTDASASPSPLPASSWRRSTPTPTAPDLARP